MQYIVLIDILQSRSLYYQAFHVRHSKRIHCRCSFRIKWLHQVNEEEALTVPSSSIMKLSTKSIHLHPTISTFFSMMESPNGLDETPCPMIVDGMNSEMDISVLLEKQIKEISNSTDISRETISTDFVFGKVDFKGQSNASIIEASLKDPNVMLPFLNKLKGSNGSENKQHTETTMKIHPVCIPSIEEEITGSRFLSPLAARAALASLRSEFPQSPLKISATSEGKGLVKELFPTSNAPQTVEVSNLSSGAQTNEIDKRERIREKKISRPSNSRFTRAKAQNINGQNEATQMTNTNGTLLTVTRARRVTRSTAEGAEKIEVEEYNATVDLQNDTFVQNAEKQNYPKRLTRTAAREGAEKVNVQSDDQKGTLIQNSEKQNYPKLTRSLSQAESEKINGQRKQKLRKSSSPELHEVDLFKEDVIVDSNTLEPENRKSCTRVKNTQKSSESGVGSYQSTRQKSSSSKKQDTRFSPRLGSLPRTRSQSRA
ncbi:hypothetical protein ACS0TY_026645 [Phlomoides rotata]